MEKTHDVEYLIELCGDYDVEFNGFFEDAEKLNPYATLFRYPGCFLVPEKDEVLDAIQVAEKILNFVENKIAIFENEVA